jgi:thiamine biosynthesis lipoprotein
MARDDASVPEREDDFTARAEIGVSVGVDRPRELRDVRRFSHEAMATVYEVYALHPDPGYAAQAAQAVFDLIDRLEGELSRFRTNSDITRINHLAAGEHTRVSPSTLECLAIARHMFDLTDGAFDISIGTGLASLELDPDAFVVCATVSGVRVDLGGIGKGYAIDLAGELLEEWDLGTVLVHGGFSSVLALDPPPGTEGWPLTLSDPTTPGRVLARLSPRQTGLGASGIRKKDHIVNPRTGTPVRNRLAAWVTVPRPEAHSVEAAGEGGRRLAAAAVADALTTAFMMMSPAEIEHLCAHGPGVEAWILEASQEPETDPRLVHFGGRAQQG